MVQFFRHHSQKDFFIFYYSDFLGIESAEKTVSFREEYFTGEKNKVILILEEECYLTEKEALFILADQNKKQEKITSFIDITGIVGIQKAFYSLYTTFARTSFTRNVFDSVKEIE